VFSSTASPSKDSFHHLQHLSPVIVLPNQLTRLDISKFRLQLLFRVCRNGLNPLVGIVEFNPTIGKVNNLILSHRPIEETHGEVTRHGKHLRGWRFGILAGSFIASAVLIINVVAFSHFRSTRHVTKDSENTRLNGLRQNETVQYLYSSSDQYSQLYSTRSKQLCYRYGAETKKNGTLKCFTNPAGTESEFLFIIVFTRYPIMRCVR
jgi:hypothetical protein